MKLPSATGAAGAIKLKINGAPVEWKFRRVTPRERLEQRAELRSWREWQTAYRILILREEEARQLYAINKATIDEIEVAQLAMTKSSASAEHLELLQVWLAKWTVEVIGLEDDAGAISWRNAEPEVRQQILDCIEVWDLDRMISEIIAASKLSEMEAEKSEPGAQPEETHSGDETNPSLAPSSTDSSKTGSP